jgi:hypothetical protein
MKDEVHILFQANKKKSKSYFLFPRSAISPIESSFDLNFTMFPGWAANLKQSLLKEFSKIPAEHTAIHWSINNLYFWRYLHFFRTISFIKSELNKNEIKNIIVHGAKNKKYKVVTNKGDESRSIFYDPDLEIPDFLYQALEKDFKIHSKKYFLKLFMGQIKLGIRIYFIFILKLFLLLLIKLIRQLKPGSLIADDNSDIVFIARSLGSADQLKRYCEALKRQGLKASIILDLNLHQGFRFAPQNTFPSADKFLTYREIFKVAVKLFFKKQIIKSLKLNISNGEFALQEDIGCYARELALASIDLEVHKIKIQNYLQHTKAKVIINGEGISPYIFLYDQLAKDLNIKSIRIQTFPFSVSDAVDFCISDGLILDSQKLTNDFHHNFPDQSDKIHYLGDFDLILKPKSKMNLDFQKIVYFTQFHDLDKSRALFNSLIRLCESSSGKIKLYIKPHPRDPEDYSKYRNIMVFSKDHSIDDCMRMADLAVSRSSSVLGRALLMGTPYIVCQLSTADQYFYAPFLDPQLDLVVTSIDEFENSLKNLKEFIIQYHENRSQFIKENFKEFDLAKLTEILGVKS